MKAVADISGAHDFFDGQPPIPVPISAVLNPLPARTAFGGLPDRCDLDERIETVRAGVALRTAFTGRSLGTRRSRDALKTLRSRRTLDASGSGGTLGPLDPLGTARSRLALHTSRAGRAGWPLGPCGSGRTRQTRLSLVAFGSG